MHILGNGYPYHLADLMTQFCAENVDEACQKLKQLLPKESYQIMMEDNTNSDSDIFNLPHSEAFNTRLGESFLKAILNIANDKLIEETSRFIKEFARPKEGNAILRERMIFE